MALSILFAFITLFFPLFLLVWRKNRRKQNLPLGPPTLPIIGNLHQFGKNPQQSLFQLSQRYGPLMYLKLGKVPVIVASSAKTAEEILKTHDLDCCSRPCLTAASKLAYNNSDIIFSSYGEQWKELKKTCIIEFFSMKKVVKFHSIREEEVDRMINLIYSQSGHVVNLSAMALRLANDITCRTALGRKYCNNETAEGSGLHEMIREAQAMLGGFFYADYQPSLGWLDWVVGMRARLEKNYKMFDEFYEKVIGEHLNTVRPGEGEDTLDALLRIQKETTTLTMDNIKALLMDIFIGGTDSSSATIEWTITELIRNPEAMKKVQEEVRGLIGKKGKVKESDIPQLNYMRCIIKEIMRLHPPVPLLVFRETIHDCKISGFDIPAKTRVIVNAWAVGKDDESWENPQEFRPERFLDSDIDLKGHDFQLIPFGAGRRICPGMHIGLAVVELALANLLYSFDWELPKGMSKEDIDMDEAPGVVAHINSDLQLVATKYWD